MFMLCCLSVGWYCDFTLQLFVSCYYLHRRSKFYANFFFNSNYFFPDSFGFFLSSLLQTVQTMEGLVLHEICAQVSRFAVVVVVDACFTTPLLRRFRHLSCFSTEFTQSPDHCRFICSLKRELKTIEYAVFFSSGACVCECISTEVVIFIFILFKFQFRSINCALFARVFIFTVYSFNLVHITRLDKRTNKQQKKVFFCFHTLRTFVCW